MTRTTTSNAVVNNFSKRTGRDGIYGRYLRVTPFAFSFPTNPDYYLVHLQNVFIWLPSPVLDLLAPEAQLSFHDLPKKTIHELNCVYDHKQGTPRTWSTHTRIVFRGFSVIFM